MERKLLIANLDTAAPALNVVGVAVTVLADRQQTGQQEFTYQVGEPGQGPPPHSHEWDETFYLTKGSVEFTVDGDTQIYTVGTLVFVPAGTIHSFRYGAEGGEMLEITGAGTTACQAFAALDAEIPPGPLDIPKVVQVAAENGVKIHV